MSTGLAKTGQHRPVSGHSYRPPHVAAQLLNQEHCNMPATQVCAITWGFLVRNGAECHSKTGKRVEEAYKDAEYSTAVHARTQALPPLVTDRPIAPNKTRGPAAYCSDTDMVTPALNLFTTADSPCHPMQQAFALSYSLNDRSEGNKPSRQSPRAGRSGPSVLRRAGSCVLHPKRSRSCPSR